MVSGGGVGWGSEGPNQVAFKASVFEFGPCTSCSLRDHLGDHRHVGQTQLWKCTSSSQGRKNSTNINFLVRISRGHSWPLRPDAQGSKSFSPPPGPQENTLFGADVHDFRHGRPWPEGLLKKFVQKKFALIFWPLSRMLLCLCAFFHAFHRRWDTFWGNVDSRFRAGLPFPLSEVLWFKQSVSWFRNTVGAEKDYIRRKICVVTRVCPLEPPKSREN